MIKLIIFDLSNVCYTLEEPPYLQQLAAENGLDYQKVDDFYQELLIKAEIDDPKIIGREVLKRTFEHFHLYKNPDEELSRMMKLRKEKKEVLKIVDRLREKYKVVYLTNYNRYYWEFVKKTSNPDAHFDFGIVSYQIKVRKPAEKGFRMLMEKFNAKPEETVFIDDSAKNLVNSKKLGIKTVQFLNVKQLKSELKTLKVL